MAHERHATLYADATCSSSTSSPSTKLKEGKRSAYSRAFRSSPGSPATTRRTATSAQPHAAHSCTVCAWHAHGVCVSLVHRMHTDERSTSTACSHAM